MYVVVLFATNGVPTTGLSPTLDVYDLSDDSQDLTGVSMSEIGTTGIYKYNWTTIDTTKDYVAIADAGVDTVDIRYPFTEIKPDIIKTLIEGSLTLQNILSILLAFVAGKSSGGGTGNILFRDQADTKDRIDMTVDVRGNRSSVTVDGS